MNLIKAVHLTLVFAFAFQADAATIAGPLPLAKPEAAGMSPERLDRISHWLTGVVERKEAAGFVTLVARHGKIVQHQAYGRMGLDVAARMPTDAVFDLASMTKPIVVTAALAQLEEGHFTLNDPISMYLPEFKQARVEALPGSMVAARNPIRVLNLFTHTSGVHIPWPRPEYLSFGTLAAHMHKLAALPLYFEPGSTWHYGSSHEVLGYLVQQIAGAPLERHIQEKILTPLGMSDTHYWPPAEKDKRRAMLVVNGKNDPTSSSRVSPAAAKAKTYAGGQSGLYSTAADYWRFSQMLLNGGTFNGHRILGPKTIAWMAQNHIGELKSFKTPGTRFGLGMAVVTDTAASGLPYSPGTYYWGGSQGTVFWIDPAEDLIGILMVQLTPSRLSLREKFSALVYSSIIER